MQIKGTINCDVFVAGSGIAGIMAAVTAAEEKSCVVISSSANLLSGSSFYPGTWGLGLIGPENEEDEKDLVQSILKVGSSMADEDIVSEFVKNINPAIKYIKDLGIELKQAENKDQKDFIPCFDHKKRNWNGILFESAKKVFLEKINNLKIKKYEYSEVIDLIFEDERIKGAVLKTRDGIYIVNAGAVVLATGGYSTIFKNYLTTDDVSSAGQYLAYKYGCSLVNMEFMQMMPAYVSPCPKTIFNEKTFRYVDIRDKFGKDILTDEDKSLLKLRSTHGPFTSRLESKKIDILISEKNPVKISYKKEIKEDMPEFIKTYFSWLYEKKHLTVDDDINISIFAHAANGGIKINKDASTEVKGLFACGEVTGGMHGADRIGGLSTANGLVFGIKAGKTASKYAKENTKNTINKKIEIRDFKIKDAEKIREKMRIIMSENAMVIRDEKGLETAIKNIQTLLQNIRFEKTENPDEIADAYRLISQLNISLIILRAQNMRKESRGSHYRQDYPNEDKNMDKNIIIKDGRIYFYKHSDF